MVERIGNPYLNFSAVLAIFLNSISIFALLHDLLNFKLAKIFDSLIDFWNTYFVQSIVFIFSFVGLELTQIIANIVVIYSIFIGITYRAIAPWVTQEQQPSLVSAIGFKGYCFILCAFWPIVLGFLVQQVARTKLSYPAGGPIHLVGDGTFERLILKFVYQVCGALLTVSFFFSINYFFL